MRAISLVYESLNYAFLLTLPHSLCAMHSGRPASQLLCGNSPPGKVRGPAMHAGFQLATKPLHATTVTNNPTRGSPVPRRHMGFLVIEEGALILLAPLLYPAVMLRLRQQ